MGRFTGMGRKIQLESLQVNAFMSRITGVIGTIGTANSVHWNRNGVYTLECTNTQQWSVVFTCIVYAGKKLNQDGV